MIFRQQAFAGDRRHQVTVQYLNQLAKLCASSLRAATRDDHRSARASEQTRSALHHGLRWLRTATHVSKWFRAQGSWLSKQIERYYQIGRPLPTELKRRKGLAQMSASILRGARRSGRTRHARRHQSLVIELMKH